MWCGGSRAYLGRSVHRQQSTRTKSPNGGQVYNNTTFSVCVGEGCVSEGCVGEGCVDIERRKRKGREGMKGRGDPSKCLVSLIPRLQFKHLGTRLSVLCTCKWQ